MDPFSLTVNIITLIDVSIKVISLLDEIKSAHSDIDKFCLDAHSLSLVLYRLKDCITKLGQHGTEAEQASVKELQRRLESDNVLGQHLACLKEICKKLEECNKTKNQKLRQIAAWKNDKSEIEKSFARLDQLRGIVNLYLLTETL